MNIDEEAAAVRIAFAAVPATFGLRAFPGKTFHVRERESYIGAHGLQLYVFTESGKAFCKASPEELREEIREAP